MDDFRNRTAKSMLTLPLVAVVAGVVWLLPDPRSVWLWGGFAIVCALTYTLRELNNRSQLLRIRSRLVSATFLALFAALPDLHSAGMHLLPAVGLLLALCCLFARNTIRFTHSSSFPSEVWTSRRCSCCPCFFTWQWAPYCIPSRGDPCWPDSSA